MKKTLGIRAPMLALAVMLMGSAALAKHEYKGEPDGTTPLEAGIRMERISVFARQQQAPFGEYSGQWCVNPEDGSILGILSVDTPERMIRYWDRLFPSLDVLVQRSGDGGRTWTPVLRSTTEGFNVDPTCAIGRNGRAYVAVMGWSGGGYNGFNLWTSQDRGRTWSEPQFFDYPEFYDRPFLATDNQAGSPFSEHAYIAAAIMTVPAQFSLPSWEGRTPGRIVVHTFDQEGDPLGSPTLVETNVGVGDGTIHMGQTGVFRDGTYLISWSEGELRDEHGMFTRGNAAAERGHAPSRFDVRVARSRDGGRSFEESQRIAVAAWEEVVDGERISSGKWYPALAIGQRPGGGEIAYLAWAQMIDGRAQIMLSHSTDSGATWSQPAIVAPALPTDPARVGDGPHRVQVSVAVNADAVLGLSFYESETVGSSGRFWSTFVISRDEGRTWSESQRITPAPIAVDDLEALARHRADLNRAAQEIPGRRRSNTSQTQSAGVSEAGRPPRRTFGIHPNCRWDLVAMPDGAFLAFPLSNEEGVWTTSVVRLNVAL